MYKSVYEPERWNHLEKLKPAIFVCGYCGSETGNNKGYAWYENGFGYASNNRVAIYICPIWGRPTFEEDGIYTPGAIYGESISGLPKDINKLYEEARGSYQIEAYTGVVLLCRKILANVAVYYGARDGKRFVEYVDYLVKNGYVPEKSKEWVDEIKKEGNHFTHHKESESLENAKKILDFVQMLLLINFKFNDDFKKMK